MVGRYIKRILVAVDQLFNAILFGSEDETLSSRMGKRVDDCQVCKFMCKLLDLIDKDHCRKSIEYDEGRRIKKNGASA